MAEAERPPPRGRFLAPALTVLFLVMTVFAGSAPAQTAGRLSQYLETITVEEMFPGADRFGPVEGEPPAAAVYRGDEVVGYLFLNSDVVNATGYSGKPIHVAVAMDLEGTIVAARLIEHSEPIVLIGIPEARMRKFIDGYEGFNAVQALAEGRRQPDVDIISGATVTVLVIGDTIVRAALRVARSRGIGAAAEVAEDAPPRAIDATITGTRSWEELLGDGSIRRLQLTAGEVAEAFAARRGEPAPEMSEAEAGETFIDLYVAQVSVPVIGESLLGPGEYRNLTQRLEEGQQAILIMGSGPYSWRGSGYVRGGIFDRIELLQGVETIRFSDRQYKRIGRIAADDAPSFRGIGLFTIPPDAEFEPSRPWQLQLLVQQAVGALEREFVAFELPYQVPEKYLEPAPAPEPSDVATAPPEAAAPAEGLGDAGEGPPLWQRIWSANMVSIGILAVMLMVLTLIFFFQDWLAKHPKLTDRVRLGFLTFSLVWLGWYANAQLSVVNILTLSNSLVTEFSWDYFLMDPLIFIQWSAVAAALIFWARGAYCGWLCPFGALQELTHRIGQFFKLPQVEVPWWLHERLWPLKYIIFLGLFGFSIYSLTTAEMLAEVEPFKTAIILNFVRDWPFVAYAVLLLVAGLFINRFFCRYLCPLGAALAIPARIRMFEWLKRWPECGSPCQRCANECPVQSIHPEGHINPNECIYCMHCQTLYWDDHRCPHMIQKRLRRERTAATASRPPIAPAGGGTAARSTANQPTGDSS